MSVDTDPGRELSPSAGALIARAARDGARADRRLQTIAADLAAQDRDRLDDRTRAAFGALMTSLIETIGNEIAQHAARTLRSDGGDDLADALLAAAPDDRRLIACLIEDKAVLREIDGRVRQDLLAAALVPRERDDPDRPSLLPRLASERDPMIAGPAMAMLLALSRRTAPLDGSQLARTDLSAEAHHCFVWHIAAELGARAGAPDVAWAAMLDRALVGAAERSLAAHDEGIRLEATAMKLAAALASTGRGGAATAIEALDDRLLALFIALVAEELALDYDAVRDAALDPDGTRLWLMLRASGMERDEIGRVGVALANADRRRSADGLADVLDSVAGLDPQAARGTFVDDRLPHAYRAAHAALAKAPS